MRNWLIRAFGGVTQSEFAEVFQLAARDRELMHLSQEFYQTQCNQRQLRIDYLEDLIFTKTGFIATQAVPQEEIKDYQPIGGARNWNTVKATMMRKDKAIIQERHKDAR